MSDADTRPAFGYQAVRAGYRATMAEANGGNQFVQDGTNLIAPMYPGTELEVDEIPEEIRSQCRLGPGVQRAQVVAEGGHIADPSTYAFRFYQSMQQILMNKLPRGVTVRIISVPSCVPGGT